ncbi:MAG: methionine adenosyltransferase [Chlamydiales bacterium]|nr:methionine adenosyltransferase [Chlamydiales bacterium]
MQNTLFTSESVSGGHPDKIADQISDAILDACLEVDCDSRVACETLVTTGLVVLAGEITTKAQLDYQKIVRKTIQDAGYTDPAIGFDYRSCGVLIAINKQSEDISIGVTEGYGLSKEQGAGDQGLMFGFACSETEELMPLPIMLAHALIGELERLYKSKELAYLRPDAKTQVSIEYNELHEPIRIDTIVISTQHTEDVTHETIVKDMKAMAQRVIPQKLFNNNILFHINPTGRFIIGGPAGDTGVTGRKIIVDSYGGMGRHGGGAFSGKDPSKVDRSGAYAARWVAKNIVAAGLANRCEVQIAYAIGVAKPVSVFVNTFGTATVDEDLISQAVQEVFDLTPKGIITALNLKRPIYKKSATGGHFGRNDCDFTWEKTNQTLNLLKAMDALKAKRKEHSFVQHLINPKELMLPCSVK